MDAVLEHPPTIERTAIDGAVYIPLALLRPSATRMQTTRRKHFAEKTLAELGESVKKHGVLQPILVRRAAGATAGQPLYEIVAGERRWRASQLAGAEAIPALVREISDFDALELQVIENLQREDLHPLEEAEGYEALMRKPDGLQGYASADELAARIGKSRSYVFGRLKLCALVAPARKAFLEGEINASTALLIARMPDSVQAEATKKIVEGWGGEPMAYRAARDYLEQHFMLKLGSAPFKITDETLHATAGSCSACGKRTGANPGLFDDIKSGDVCTDSACFGEKKTAHQARLIATAKAEGREVIVGAAAKKVMPRQYSSLNGYLKLDEADYRVDGMKPIRKLLGKDAPPTVLLESPHTHELLEVVREDEAMRVLKDKGHVRTSRLPTSSARVRNDEAKAKAETAWRMAVAEKTIAAVVDPKFDDVDLHAWLLPEVAIAMWERLDYETEKLAAKLLGWDQEDRFDRGEKIGVRTRKLTAGQLDQMFAAMAIAGQVRSSMHSTAKPERLLRIAAGLNVDVEKIKAELAAAAKAKAKKPAAKKATPAAPSERPAAKGAAEKKAKAAPKAATGRVPVKYRNAATGETWSGRGLQPRWLKAALLRGKTLADFEVGAGTPVEAGAKAIAKTEITEARAPVQLSAVAAWPFPPGTR